MAIGKKKLVKDLSPAEHRKLQIKWKLNKRNQRLLEKIKVETVELKCEENEEFWPFYEVTDLWFVCIFVIFLQSYVWLQTLLQSGESLWVSGDWCSGLTAPKIQKKNVEIANSEAPGETAPLIWATSSGSTQFQSHLFCLWYLKS